MSVLAVAQLPDSAGARRRETHRIEVNRCRYRRRPRTPGGTPLVTQFLRSRTAGAMLTAAIVGLTAATAYIHL
ncbi:MAG TPA: hypothetical protein VFN76_06785, partial [Candidatus Limnocylindria bacterium]|nr:hypothetical protein [Candidatus Limnocylindria bacterium]